MEWDWKSEAYTALKWLAALLTTIGANYIRKKFKPFVASVRSFINIHATISTNKKLIEYNATKLFEIEELINREIDLIKEKEIAALQISTTPVFKVDGEGNLFFVNGAWLDMVGSNNADEMYGRGYLRAIPSEDVSPMNAQTEWMVKHPTSFAGEVRFKHLKTGEIINTYCRTDVIKDRGNQKVIEILGRLEVLSK